MNGRMYDPVLSSFLSPDNYMQDPTSQQGFNRYAYCMYNPLKYVDPSGERCCGVDWTFYMEQAMDILRRINYEQYLIAMASTMTFNPWITALFSMGQCSNGFGLSQHHGCGGGDAVVALLEKMPDYETKCASLGITPGQSIPKEKWTDEFIKQFQEAFFPDAPMEYVINFVVEGIDKNYMFYSKNNNGAGRTRPQDNNGILTGISNVFFNDDYVFNSPEFLFYTMGHELIHVSQFAALAGEPFSLAQDDDFVSIIEYNTALWEHTMGNYKNYFLYVPTSDVFNKYQYLYDRVNYINYSWTYELYKFLKP